MLVDGVKGFVIVLVYTVVPALVLSLAVAPVFLFSSASASGVGAGDGSGGGGVLTAVILLVGFVAGLAAATVLGVLLIPFVNFFGNVAAVYALGAGVREQTGAGADPEK